jgi:hypothetical protein
MITPPPLRSLKETAITQYADKDSVTNQDYDKALYNIYNIIDSFYKPYLGKL